ncbi:type VII secretion protein EssC, partial [Listeria welshimeri]|nr:type VII secretion protein EssC [Listeria welshimeri]
VDEFVANLDPTIVQIAREGASLGIHLMITANNQNAMRLQLLSNIKTQIALHLNEKNEVSNIVGRSDYTIDELPGRGLFKIEEPTLFQMALPNNVLPIGIEYEYASPGGIALEQHNLAVIMPTVELVQQIITNSSHLLIKKELRELVIFDTPSMELMKLKELPLTYITNSERVEGKVDILYGAFKTAEKAY